MAHTNQTPNYGLSEFIGSDKPAWLVDYNGDMEKIDLGLKAAKDVADAAKTEADQGALDIAAVTITANSADAKATAAVSDLADAYDSTSTYNVGDFVIYNNILYRCITAISVPESFDGTHWARTTLEEIITQINSDLTALNGKAITPTLIKENKTMQCDAVYVPAYTYTASKKTVISLSVKGSWGNGVCLGIRFKIDGILRQECEENNIPNASFSTVLEVGQSIQVDVKYSNYTLNNIIIDGFALQIG